MIRSAVVVDYDAKYLRVEIKSRRPYLPFIRATSSLTTSSGVEELVSLREVIWIITMSPNHSE